MGASILLALWGCSDDENNQTLTLTDLKNLPELGSGFVYEGWLIVNQAPISTGRFNITAGVTTPAQFTVDSEDVENAEIFVLTIEPATDDDPMPSETKVIAGGVTGNSITADASHKAAIGSDFLDAAGSFILAAPTDNEAPITPEQGIWWLVPGAPASPSLMLPTTLPPGWVYEGWVVSDGVPTSTGRFTAVNDADEDGAGPKQGANPDAAPPFPGQDFISPPALVLNDGSFTAVITVEPEPDNAATPFSLKPLALPISLNAATATSLTMNNDAANTLPSATITIVDDEE